MKLLFIPDIKVALVVASLFIVLGGVVTTSLSSIVAVAYAEHDISKEKTHGKGWPKTSFYIPRNAEGLTGLTIAQCDSPEQCKEVNGTPSPNLAAKKQCEEFSGEKCRRISGIP